MLKVGEGSVCLDIFSFPLHINSNFHLALRSSDDVKMFYWIFFVISFGAVTIRAFSFAQQSCQVTYKYILIMLYIGSRPT